MKDTFKPIRTTIIGGMVFLIPVVIIAAILGKAFALMSLVAKPLDAWIPAGSIGGIALANILAAVGILVLCFMAGLVARSAFGTKILRSLESGLLTAIPGYAFVKGFTDTMASSNKVAEGFVPVMIRFDDYTQIGFEIERTQKGITAVYLPGAPNPWSGSVVYVSKDRIERLDIPMTEAIRNIQRLGRGSVKMGKL